MMRDYFAEETNKEQRQQIEILQYRVNALQEELHTLSRKYQKAIEIISILQDKGAANEAGSVQVGRTRTL